MLNTEKKDQEHIAKEIVANRGELLLNSPAIEQESTRGHEAPSGKQNTVRRSKQKLK